MSTAETVQRTDIAAAKRRCAAISAPDRAPLDLRRARELCRRNDRRAQRLRHRPRRSRRDRAAERPGDGDRVSRHRRGRRRGAAQSGLSRPRNSNSICPTSAPRRWSSKRAASGPASKWRKARHRASLTLRPNAEAGAGAFELVRRARRQGRRRAGCAERGRCRADPAHFGHDLAAEDRAAVAAQRQRLRPTTSREASSSRRPTAASTSCRCSTSTG